MQIPLRITFRDLPVSEAIETRIREHAAKLEKHCARLTGCNVTVDAPHRHKHQGNHFRVRIDLSVPGSVLVVNRDPPEQRSHEDAHAAVEAAFDEADRLLRDHSGRQLAARRHP